MRPLNKSQSHSSDEVRGGSEEHVVRYVLGFGLLLAIAGLTATWTTGAFLL